MFETREQYLAALDAAQDKQAFQEQHGSPNDYPSEAELAVTEVAQGPIPNQVLTEPMNWDQKPQQEEQGLEAPVQPKVVNNETGDEKDEDTSEAYQGELEQQEEYAKELKRAEYQGKIEEARLKGIENTSLRGDDGEILYDVDGQPIRRELSTVEKIDNSVQGMMSRMTQLVPNMQITAGEIMKRLVPEELWDDYNEHGDASVLANMPLPAGVAMAGQNLFTAIAPTEETVDEAIMEKEVIQAEQEARGETGSITKGIKEGDIGEVAAGVANAMTSFVPSMVMATATFGTSTASEFFGDSYVEYNKARAKAKGKTLEELREDGEDSFTAPAGFAALMTASEMVGLKGASDAILKNVGKDIAKKVATVGLAGNKEGLTELFQTGLERARDNFAAKENTVEAAKQFADAVFSEEGLESYLQGFVGGAGFSGGGSIDRGDINQMKKAAAAMRAPEDTEGVYNALAKRAELEQLKQNTKDPDLLSNYEKQQKDLDQFIKGAVVQANGYARKMDDSLVKKAAKLVDERSAAKANFDAITEKFNKGEITVEEKNAAAQGYSATVKDINRREQEIKDQLEEQPTIREKDGKLKNKTKWQTQTAPAINEIAQRSLTKDGSLTEEGKWEILESPKVKDLVKSVISKRFAAQGQEYDAVLAEDLEAELLYGGKQSIAGLLSSWNASKGANPASYIYGQIQNKLTGKLAKMEDKTSRGATQLDQQREGARQVEIEDTDSVVPTARRRTAAEQAQRLGIGGAFEEGIRGKMETLIADGVLKPTDKKFESEYVNRFRKHLLKPIKQQLGRKRDEFENFLNENAENLLEIYSKRTLAKKRNDEAFEWIENPPTVQEFIDYHMPLKQGGALDEGLMAKRKTRLAEALAEGIGFRAMEDTIADNVEQSTRGRINEGFDQVINKLRQLQGERGTLQSNPLGIVPAALEGAVIAAKKAYNLSADLNNALQEGYKKIADKVSFEQFRDYMLGQIRETEGEGFRGQTQNYMEQREQAIQEEIQEAAQVVQKDINGFNHDQFQESTAIADDDFAAQSKATDKILQEYMPADAEYRKTVNTKDPAQFEAGRQWIANTLTKYFPKEFFQQGMFANAGKSAAERGFFATSKDDVDGLAVNAKSDPNSVWNKNGRYIYGNKDLKDIKQNWSKIQENNKNNWAAFENMWQTFDQMIKDDINNAPMIAAFLKGAQNSQNHISRTAAPLIAYSQDKGGHPRYEEEHSLPQSAVSRYMMQTLLSGGDVNAALENVQKNFFQVALNKNDDKKLKVKGKYNYASTMPDGWKMSDNTWARYFNANVNGNNGGIDPNSITFFNTGKTVAETYGAEVKGNKTPDVIAAQQRVVSEQVGDRFESLLDRSIAGLEKLTGPKGALQANIAAVPLHVMVGGLRATKLAYRGARDLAQAIEAGYQHVKDYMSRQEWADFTSKAVREIKDQKTPAQKRLATVSENALKMEQERQIAEQAMEAESLQDTEGTNNNISQEFDDMFATKKLGRITKTLNKYLLGSEAEDFRGLMYRLMPGGDQSKEWFENNLIKPYERGILKYKAFRQASSKVYNDATKTYGTDRLAELDINDLKNDTTDPTLVQLREDLNKIDNGEFVKSLDPDIPLQKQMIAYQNNKKRAEFLEGWKANIDAALKEDGQIKKSISGKLGPEYTRALNNMLGRMESGTNRQGWQVGNEHAKKLVDFINDSNSVIMHLNGRSALLQTLSALNYTRAAGTYALNPANYVKNFNDIWNSDYMHDRWDTNSFDIDANEIATGERKNIFARARQAALEKGFYPTKFVDGIAIAMGGGPLYTKLLDKHNGDKEAAMEEFIAFTEEGQQSADPSKISQLQAGTAGRLVFAFLNTPFQYARLTKRAVQDISNKRGSVPDNLSKIAYYTFIQSMAFTMMQNLINPFDEEEDDTEEWKIQNAMKSWVGSNLKTMGYHGAIASWMYDIYNEFEGQASGEKRVSPTALALSATKVSPPVSRKLEDVRQIGKYLYRQNRGDDKKKLEALARATDIANMPFYRWYQKIDNLIKAADEDAEASEKILRFFGYTDYALGKPEDRHKAGEISFDSGVKWDDDIKWDDDVEWDGDSPFKRTLPLKSSLAGGKDSPLKFIGAIKSVGNLLNKLGGGAAIGTPGSIGTDQLSAAMDKAKANAIEARTSGGEGGNKAEASGGGLPGLVSGVKARRSDPNATGPNAGSAGPAEQTGEASLTPEMDQENAAQEAQAEQTSAAEGQAAEATQAAESTGAAASGAIAAANNKISKLLGSVDGLKQKLAQAAQARKAQADQLGKGLGDLSQAMEQTVQAQSQAAEQEAQPAPGAEAGGAQAAAAPAPARPTAQRGLAGALASGKLQGNFQANQAQASTGGNIGAVDGLSGAVAARNQAAQQARETAQTQAPDMSGFAGAFGSTGGSRRRLSDGTAPQPRALRMAGNVAEQGTQPPAGIGGMVAAMTAAQAKGGGGNLSGRTMSDGQRPNIDALFGGIKAGIGATPFFNLQNGELGQAHDDGTIEVAPGQSPMQRKKTINHEQKHIDDMKNGELSYTDNSLTYKGKTYQRKDGMINFNGKWMREGSKSFPWERVATAAEKGPLRKDAKIKNSK